MQFRVQTLVCVPNRQPKGYHPTRVARVGTPGLDSELPASNCITTKGSGMTIEKWHAGDNI